MYKAWISIGACTGLSMMIMIHVFHGLDAQPGLDSQQALNSAEKSLSRLCEKHGFSAKGMRLMSELAPDKDQAVWRFQFNTLAMDKPLTIEVDGRGQAYDAS